MCIRDRRKWFAAAASFSFERGKERLDTFPQLIRHITKICLFHGTRLPHLLKSKNMPDILLIKGEKEFLGIFYKIFLKIQEKEDPFFSLQQQVGEQFYLFKKRNSC